MSGLYYDDLNSPVGTLRLVVSDRGVRALLWENDRENRVPLDDAEPTRHHGILIWAKHELAEYFEGRRRQFTVPLDPKGTPFQKRAWQALRQIPYGKTLSYGEQAKRIGDPKGARAVGAANGRNPISILVPCHRVVAKDGNLTGFAGGLKTKRFLLDLERRHGA